MQKTIRYLIYLFIFLLPWQTRWIIFDPQINSGVWEYGRISLYGFDIIFILLCIMYYVLCIKQKNYSLLITHYLLLIITLLLYYFITFIFTDNKLISFYWFLRILQGFLLFYIINKINLDKIKAALAFIISMSLSAGLGIYQFLTQSAFAFKWFGLASHSASILGDSVVELTGERWLRAYGSFPHPNILAGFCVIAVIFCFYLFNKYNEFNLKKFLLITNYLLLIIGLFFTFSRAAWIAFIVIIFCCLFSFLSFRRKPESSFWIPTFVGMTGLIVFCILSVIYFPLVKTRIIGAERLEVKSNIERMSGYNQAFEIIKNNIFLGTGLGNYTVALQKIYSDKPAYFYQPAHNVYLLVLSEVGIVGIIFITLLLYYFIKQEKRKEKREIKFFVTDYLLLITIYFFLFFFDHFWWTLPSGLLLVFLVFGFLNKRG